MVFDAFGHELHCTPKETAALQAMSANDTARAKVWSSTDFSTVSPKRMKKLVREGIPNNLRHSLWLHLTGASLERAQHPVTYFTKLAARAAPKSMAHDVEVVIARSMPGHQTLSTPAGLHAVVSLVTALAMHTGQPMQANTTSVAAFMVSVIGLRDLEDCFWILNGLLNHILPATCMHEGFGSVECCVLAELLQKKFPRLLSAFAAMDCHLHEITSTWFSHLFTMSLPATTAVRVWDCLLCEGPKVLFRVALALLKRQESIVIGNMQKLRTLEWRVSRTFAADELLRVAFSGIGSLSLAVILRAREGVESQVHREQAQHAKRLEALLCPPKLSPRQSVSSMASDLSIIVE